MKHSSRSGLFGLFGRKNKAEEPADPTESAVEEQTSPTEESQPDATLSDDPHATPSEDADSPVPEPEPEQETVTASAPRPGLFGRLRQGLQRTRQHLGEGVRSLFRGRRIDDELYEDLETQLLTADVGVATTTRIIDNLTATAKREALRDAEALTQHLQQELRALLEPVSQPLQLQDSPKPQVILVVGVKGVAKPTTIGNLARQFQQQGKKVMLAAGDTFRAAAVEQLQIWGERNAIPVIAQHTGADSASVIYDAVQAAQSRGADILIADTAGRLQNKAHLMEELKKVTRVMQKLDPTAPHETLLVLDATTGQNAISQADLFKQAVGVSGIVLTKMDGTAKGGVIFSVADRFGIPIRYIGVGEQIDDLRPFEADSFVQALFGDERP